MQISVDGALLSKGDLLKGCFYSGLLIKRHAARTVNDYAELFLGKGRMCFKEQESVFNLTETILQKFG